MLSKRNFIMMMTMILVVFALFLFPVGLKAYFNDYSVNHAAKEAEIIERIDPEEIPAADPVLYFGAEDSAYDRVVREWAAYRKKSLQTLPSLLGAGIIGKTDPQEASCLLLDGQLLSKKPDAEVKLLTKFVEQGGTVIFLRLPDYSVIESHQALRDLLGIQHLRGQSVQLSEIRLFGGFLLGGETHYSFEDARDPELADLIGDIPWYDISSRTKSYMVGFLSEAEKSSLGIHNEDMPAIIWRSNLGNGSVFAVNGDYMAGETALGLLDAMLYESSDYALYPVVNAQNLSIAGFPSLTVENEEVMAQTYGMTNQQFCRDILWPSLVAATQKQNWKATAFLSPKHSDASLNQPDQNDLIDYLKFFNETSTEAGIVLGRMDATELRTIVEEDAGIFQSWDLNYAFSGGYIRRENREKLSAIIGGSGQMEFFGDIRTLVEEYEPDRQILSWLTDRITLQNTTATAYRHSDRDSLRLKSLETALGYSNVMVDMYPVLWPETSGDSWEYVAEKMASNIDTFWKPFSAFEKTTITESDRRVRNFLNGTVESSRIGDEITIRTAGFTGEAYLLLRTHGQKPETMTGGTWKQVEEDTYLLRLDSQDAVVILGAPAVRYDWNNR